MGESNKQSNSVLDDSFPDYLQSYDALEQYFRAQLEGLTTSAKGDRFAHFVQRVVPQTEAGSDFHLPVLREKKSGDEGVDLVAQGKDGRSILYIQSKLWLDRAEKIDSVVSNFQAYLRERQAKPTGQQYLFDLDDQTTHFLLVTLSPLQGIRSRYEARAFGSKPFFEQYVSAHRMNFIDGQQILSILRGAYRKIYERATNLVLNLETPVVNKDNVFIGIVSSSELRRLYCSCIARSISRPAGR